MESFWMILFFAFFFGAIIVLLIRAAIHYPETEEERKMHEFTRQAAHNQAELNRSMKKL